MNTPLRPLCAHCGQRKRAPLTPAQKAAARERARKQYDRRKAKEAGP